jgi:DegV family protein with EDD domain
MKLKIMCNSTASLKEEFIQENNIEVIPLNVTIDNVSYKDGEISLEEVMDKFYAGAKVSSSQPSPLDFISAFNKAKEEGYTDILCFTISSTLSGTYNSASLAKNEVKGINIHLVDTLTASIGEELLIHSAVDYLKDNSLEATLEYLEKLKENAVILLNMENLTALKMSGRITRIKAAIGNLIRVKPILEYIGGKLSVITKFRTENRVFEYIIDRIGKELNKVKNKLIVYLGYVRNDERVVKLKELIEEKYKNLKVYLSGSITPVVAINIGYGGYGIAWAHE